MFLILHSWSDIPVFLFLFPFSLIIIFVFGGPPRQKKACKGRAAHPRAPKKSRHRHQRNNYSFRDLAQEA